MPPAGFEPEIPASERPQTHALDRAATRIGRDTEIEACNLVTILTYRQIVSPSGVNKVDDNLQMVIGWTLNVILT